MIEDPELKSGYFLWLRHLFRTLGFYRTTAFFTLASMVFSAGLTNLISLFTSHRLSSLDGTLIAVIVPAIIAPLFSAINLRLLFLQDEAEIKLQKMSIRDDMTGAANRRYFLNLVDAELLRIHRYGSQFSVAFLDIDDFKNINDVHGHLAGDDVLRFITKLGIGLIRATDTFARYAGDEFVILMPNTGSQPAMDCLQRICKTVAETPILYGDTTIFITVSAGVITTGEETLTLEALLTRVDRALYNAKRLGKNRVSNEELLITGNASATASTL